MLVRFWRVFHVIWARNTLAPVMALDFYRSRVPPPRARVKIKD